MKAVTLKPGSRGDQIMTYLRREMVNSTLHFTIEHVREVMKETGMRMPEYVWNTIQDLENQGLLRRHKIKGKKGIDISFPTPEKTTNVKVEPASQKVMRARTTTRKATPMVLFEKSLDHLIEELGETIRIKGNITAGLISDAGKASAELELLMNEHRILVSAREILGRRKL